MNLLNEREKTHGDFEDVSRIAQALKECLRHEDGSYDSGGYKLPCVHSEALDLICTKIARIICGDHNEPDHWTDIKGYAELVLKHVKAESPGDNSKEPPDETKRPVGACAECGAPYYTAHRVGCGILAKQLAEFAR